MNRHIKVIFIEDDENDVYFFKRVMNKVAPLAELTRYDGLSNNLKNRLQSDDISILFTDLSVNGAEPRQVTEFIKMYYDPNKTVLLTGYSDLDFFNSAKEDGFNYIVTKNEFSNFNLFKEIISSITQKHR